MRQDEDRLQEAVVEWLKLLSPPWLFWHTPNGGKRSIKTAKQLKAMGTRPGVPDLTFQANNGYVAYIEMKAPGKESALTDGQRMFRNWCKRNGTCWAVASSLHQVKDWLQLWGFLDGKGRPIHPPADLRRAG